MKVITERSQIRDLAARLKQTWYKPAFEGVPGQHVWARILQPQPDTEKIYLAVLALDPETATREDVARAMCSSLLASWWIQIPTCDECGERVEAVVHLGGDENTADICIGCLRQAIMMGDLT